MAVGVGMGCPAEPPAFPGASTEPTTETPGDGDGDSDGGSSMLATDATGSDASVTAAGSSEGGPSTADAATSAQPTGADTSEGPPSPCGDGALDPDEDCDDGDRSEIDGCTTSCEIGPIGIAIDEDGGMNTVVNFGGGGATVVEASCPAGEVLVGLEVWVTPLAIAGIGARCGTLDLVDADPTSIEVGPGTELTLLGVPQGSSSSRECPPGQVLGQLSAAGDSGELTGLGPTCRALAVTGTGSNQALAVQAGDELEQVGPQMPFSPSSCQPGQVATALRVPMIDDEPAGIGLRCSPIALAYP